MSRPMYDRSGSNGDFICENCGMPVSARMSGGRNRNHCPFCLHSLHVDRNPGDRLCHCKGMMVPISLWTKNNREICILHYCTRCSTIKSNRMASDDDETVAFALLDKIQLKTAAGSI